MRTPDEPVAPVEPAAPARRPRVAILDTGCGRHDWLDGVVTRLRVDSTALAGIDESTPAAMEPEWSGDIVGPLDGYVDAASGHGTFIAGIVRQGCPDAEILSIRVADSQGTVMESDFVDAIERLADLVESGTYPVDVLSLSLGYYHETPEDGLFSLELNKQLARLRRQGCAVVCSAGNDATDRPAFPAALWNWDVDEYKVEDPGDAAPHVSVGALNPNASVALFSNTGRWVDTYAPGVSILSTAPTTIQGGLEPGTRDERGEYLRETIDPDDFSGGFALWSGTSFAAPLIAARLAAAVADGLLDGTTVDDVSQRQQLMQDALTTARKDFTPRKPGKAR